MDRPSTVARTPVGETNVNRLRAPSFGVQKLYLKAGAKSGKSHRPEGSPKLDSPDEGGNDDFNFAPSKDEVSIIYEIHNPFGVVDGGKLELFTRFEETPLWSVDLAKLGGDWWALGKHTVKWDGRVVKDDAEVKGSSKDGGIEHDLTGVDPDDSNKDEFPDGYTNLKHTPYKLKLSLTAKAQKIVGNPAVAWTHFHVLIKKLELE